MTEERCISLTYIEWNQEVDSECGELPDWFSWNRFAESRLQQFAAAQVSGVEESFIETSAFEDESALTVNA